MSMLRLLRGINLPYNQRVKTQKKIIFGLVFIALVSFVYLNTPLKHAPVVGDVELNSEASQLGFFAGDRIESVNSVAVHSWEDFETELNDLNSDHIQIGVERDGNPATVDFDVTAQKGKDIEGLSNYSKMPLLLLKPESILIAHGVKSGDQLLSVNGQKIKYWREIGVQLHQRENSNPLVLDILSTKGTKLKIELESVDEGYSLETLGLEDPALYVFDVKKGSFAAELGLKRLDRLLLVQGQSLKDGFDWASIEAGLAIEKILNVAVVRDGDVKYFSTPIDPENFSKLLENAEPTLSSLHRILGIRNDSVYIASPTLKEKNYRRWLLRR